MPCLSLRDRKNTAQNLRVVAGRHCDPGGGDKKRTGPDHLRVVLPTGLEPGDGCSRPQGVPPRSRPASLVA